MENVEIPKCPQCKVRGEARADGLFLCPKCHGLFDSNPDEGGDFGNRPSDRMQRADKRREQMARKFGRRQ